MIAPADLRLGVQAASALARAGALRPLPPARMVRAMRDARTFGTGLASAVALSAARDPDGVAVVDDFGTLSWRELQDRAARLAGLLAGAHGAGPQRPLWVMCRNHRGPVESLVAAALLGADVLLLNTDFPGPQLAQALEGARPGVLVCDAEFIPALAQAGQAPALVADGDRPEAPPWTASPSRRAQVTILSSGTTGAPKGAARSPSLRAVCGPMVTLVRALRLRTGQPMLLGPPLFHGFGLSFVALGLTLGTPLILRRRFDAHVALQDVVRHEAGTVVGVPVMLQRMLDVPDRPPTPSLRAVASAGAPLPPRLAVEFQDAFGDVLFNLYGSTEVGFAALAGPRDLRVAPGAVGRPPIGSRLAVLGPDRRPVASGETGVVFVGGELAFDGYTGGGGKEGVDGLLNTGDLGHVDEHGLLHVDGREDDMVVSGGENVFPQEVEDLLAAHPAVREVAVVGVEDETFGQRLRACVVLRDAAAPTEEELLAHVRRHVARYKVPREVVFLDELPRNPTGKVLRRRLVALDGIRSAP